MFVCCRNERGVTVIGVHLCGWWPQWLPVNSLRTFVCITPPPPKATYIHFHLPPGGTERARLCAIYFEWILFHFFFVGWWYGKWRSWPAFYLFFFKQWPAYPLQFISRGLAISFVTQTDIHRHWNSVGKISFFFRFLSFFPSLSSFHLLLLHAVPIWHHHRNDLYNDDTRAFRMRRKGEPLVKTFCGSPGAYIPTNSIGSSASR